MARHFCAIARSNCEAPPGIEPLSEASRTSCVCFACGEPACKACSDAYPYLGYGRQRVCDNCQLAWGRKREVLAKEYRLAGYPEASASILAGAPLSRFIGGA